MWSVFEVIHEIQYTKGAYKNTHRYVVFGYLGSFTLLL